jgi:CxC2 like cysteine cluster associated with KDZ transposases
MDRRHSILIEILRHEALPSQSTCSHCGQSLGTHRCQDCFGPHLLCGPCCLSTHAHLPFHHVQMWNGHFFERLDLLTHSLSLDLRHYPDNCPTIHSGTETDIPFDLNLSDEDNDPTDGYQPSEAQSAMHSVSRSEIIIVSSTGICTRSVRWCHCAKSPDRFVELLLRAKLFPASFKNPKTAFTFEVLDHFRVDALECKTAAMNFMSKLRRMTNEAFPSRVPVSNPIDRTFILIIYCNTGPL